MLYDQAGNLLSEVDSATGQAITEYVWLDGAPLAYIEAGNTYQVHVDHLGTPQVLTDGTGQVAWEAHYTPFGRASVISQGPTFNLRFPGQYFDAETGLHYNWHRYYDPAIGRYITSDPIGLAGGLNTYGYVGGNPIQYVDPSGEAIKVVIGAAVGGISGCVGAVNDPCSDVMDVASGTLEGAAIGALGAAIPIGGTLLGAVGRNFVAGFFANSTGQIVASGPEAYKFSQSLVQAAIAGAGGGYGNMLGLNYALTAARAGSASALKNSYGVGTIGAIATGTVLNTVTPADVGGLNSERACGCQR